MRGKESVKKRKGGFNIQSIIMSVLMASTLITITIMGLLLYHRFKLAIQIRYRVWHCMEVMEILLLQSRYL